jgi:hypothetical protein
MKLPASTRDAIAIGMLAIGLLVAVILVALAPVAWAEDAATVRLSLKDHRFQPAEARAPAGKPITIENQEPRRDAGGIRVQDLARRKSRHRGRHDHRPNSPARGGAVQILR